MKTATIGVVGGTPSRRRAADVPARRQKDGPAKTQHLRGFTLLEVMIALTLFFLAVFSILSVVSQGLGAARSLQVELPDVSALAAELVLTNRLEEGMEEGDYGDVYPGFSWRRETVELATNGFFRVDLTVYGNLAGRPYEATTRLLLWRPESSTALPGLRR